MVVSVCALSVAAGAKERVTVNPKTATLAEAVADWVGLLEKDEPKAAERWLAGEKARESMGRFWGSLRELHEQHDYRSWLEKQPVNAKGIGSEKRFTVGGHEFGHLHVVWVKARAGWRIEDVLMCR
jgi:hypothetical protein